MDTFTPTPPQTPSKALKRVNNALLIILVLINLYVIAVPFLPQILFQVQRGQGGEQALETSLQTPPQENAPSSSTEVPAPAPSPSPAATKAKATGNQLVVPAMLLEKQIKEHPNAQRGLDLGVWRWPGGSSPDKGSNTVLVGHRFTYTNPKGVFYFLDKMRVGDTVGIVWSGKTYVYRVNNVQTVPPTQTSILAATEKPTLTMYTCTPLWLPKERLVVTATLETIDGVQQ